MTRYLTFTLSILSLFFVHQIYGQCWPAQTFTTAGEYNYTVPGTASDLYTIAISADGADGGDFLWGSNPSSAGGAGASLIGEWEVSGGDNLLIIVGESGFDAIGSPGGGGGGGGTAVILNNTDVLIAAAAGGGGGQNTFGEGGQGNTNSPAQGGGGPGASGGGGFNQAGQNGQAGTGGGAGTLTGQGLGGTQGVVAGPGGNGFGGGGGGAGTTGGGGGGYQGGDGASNGSLNGKGGDSYINMAFNGQVIAANAGSNGGGSNRDGVVAIECASTVTNTLSLDVLSSTDPTCNGLSDGMISVEATMGTAPYSYSLNGGTPQSSGTFTGLGAGTYTIEAEDNTGATISITEVLTEPTELLLTYVDQQDVLCFGDMTGSITVSGSGGTTFPNGTYNYYVNNIFAGTTGIITGLSQGTYVVLLEDANDCTDMLTVDVLSNDEIVLTTTQAVNISCNGGGDGIIEINATGGFGAFTYSLNGLPGQSSGLYTNLTADTYDVMVTDGDGCTATTSVTLTEPTTLTATAVSIQPTCSSPLGSATVTASGGTMPYEYSIDGMTFQTSNVFDGLSAGTYDITVIDDNNCMTMTSVTIGTFDNIVVVATGQNLTCNSSNGTADGSITLSITGGMQPYTFLWTTNDGSQTTPNQQDQMNLAAGTYTVVVGDQLGCNDSTSLTLTEPASITYGSQTTDVTCHDGSDGAIEVSNLSGGTAPITLAWSTTDGTGLQGNSALQSGLSTGTYALLATDAAGCTASESFTLTAPMPLNVTLQADNASCTSGGGVTIIAEGGTAPYTYSIDNVTFVTTNVFTDLSASSYMAFIMDDRGCTTEVPFDILGSADAITVEGEAIQATCHENNGTANGMITLTVDGGDGNYSYQWSGPGVDATAASQTGLYTGTYSVVVSDGAGCSAMAMYTLVEPEEMIAFINTTAITCNGDSDGMVDVTDVAGGTPPYTYQWSSGGMALTTTGPTLTNVVAGTYAAIITDSNGCSITQSTEVTDVDAVVLDVDASQVDNQWTVVLTGSGGVPPYQYAVDDVTNPADQSSYDLPSGTYTFYVIDANGCITSSTMMLGATSIGEIVKDDQVLIMPNPASDRVTISAELMRDTRVMISCYSIDGSLQIQQDVHINTDGEAALDIESLEAGMHLIVIQSGAATMTAKLLVQ